MFIAALVYNSQDMEATYMPISRRIDKKLWYIYTMEYYSVIKKNTFESVLMRWIKLEFIGRSQDGGGIGRGDHFLFYKFIERTTERWTKFTKQLLITSDGHQAPRKAAHCLQREVGQGYWRLKRETRERGRGSCPGKGVLIEEVSNHQETLALADPGEVFRSRRAT